VRRSLDTEAEAAASAANGAWTKAMARARGAGSSGGLGRWLGLAAAAGLAALLLFWPGDRAQASPQEALARAREAHTAPLSREYSLVGWPPPALVRRLPTVDFARKVTIWTRGDRFRVEPAPGGGVWGQDEEGNVWAAPTPRAGAYFRPDEVPERFRELLAVRAVHLPSLLDEVLKDCELTARRVEEPPGVRIDARGQGSLSSAYLFIRPDGVIQYLSLSRRLPGGESRVSLELLSEAERPEEVYRLSGNLAPGAEVYGPERPRRRLALLARLIGAR
jgi:hypothetical protein